MTPIRLAGSVIGLIDGTLAAFMEVSGPSVHPLCLDPQTLCTSQSVVPSPEMENLLLGAGVILAIISLVSFTGFRLTFVLGAVLSAAVLVTVGLTWGTYATDESAAAAGLAVVTLTVDAVASRPSKGLSEKDSPLNLPVFG
ncbi:MAG TPA: hypothetical protein VND40_04175 [Nitrososphaerales archaeon]|nr:hypothetical protein [Nitrososphaerales archaeon]